MTEDNVADSFASPPCYMHEVDPAYTGLVPVPDHRTWTDVARFRKAERERLIKERLAIPANLRANKTALISEAIIGEVGNFDGRVVSAYWPFRGEPDLRPLLKKIRAAGGRTALPVVVEQKQPLEFRLWEEGEQLERGVWNIPVPSAGATCVPDIVIAPLVGYDPKSFRLGYGGGFFDRTLQSLPDAPTVIGVGYCNACISTICPQAHDIPMDLIVTEQGIVIRRGRAAG